MAIVQVVRKGVRTGLRHQVVTVTVVNLGGAIGHFRQHLGSVPVAVHHVVGGDAVLGLLGANAVGVVAVAGGQAWLLHFDKLIAGIVVVTIARINAASETGDKQGSAKDPDWLLGEKNRTKGSIHTDVWRGTAADLANRGFLAVYPANGWWRTRPKQRRYNLPAKYSLIVSISTPEVGVDLYAVVESVVKTTVEV